MDGDTRPTGPHADAPGFVREGMRLARDLCRDLGLPDPHAPGFPAPAIIAGLAATRGWTVTARVATPEEWRGMEALNARRRGDDVGRRQRFLGFWAMWYDARTLCDLLMLAPAPRGSPTLSREPLWAVVVYGMLSGSHDEDTGAESRSKRAEE